MVPVPKLTDAELAMLTESIRQDGVTYPVLVGPDGKVIDGHHRKQICDELGLDCPTQALDVDGPTAERLAVTLNLARRHLSTAQRYELIAWLAERHQAEAAAAAHERKAKGGFLKGKNELTDSELVSSTGRHQTEAVADVARRVNADLADMGEAMRITPNTVERARTYAKASPEQKAAVAAGRMSATDIAQPGKKESQRRSADRQTGKRTSKRAPIERRTPPEILDAQARIRATDAELQYQSMLNAPAGKLNLPFLRRAEQIQMLLDDLFELDAEKAAGQVPPERLPEFSTSRGEWWATFARLCEKRWEAEVPDLPPHRPVRLLPLAERDLNRGDLKLLEWLRSKPGPVMAVEAAVALRIREDYARARLGRLVEAELAEVAGRVDRRDAFRALLPRLRDPEAM